MRSTADGALGGGDGVWGEGKCVRKKMNGVGGEDGLQTDLQRKEQKWKVIGGREEGKN